MTRHFLPLLVLTPLVSAATYNLLRDYSGETFFDGWNFFGAADEPNNGDAMYDLSLLLVVLQCGTPNYPSPSEYLSPCRFVTKEVGTTGDNRLAYVDPNTKRAIIKVDNTTQVIYDNKRNTVRIDTKDTYPIGSVWVADMYHVPYGCSVWPAWWSHNPTEKWPAGGEIDTFEGVNLVEQNQISLHTNQGCKLVNPIQSSTDVRNPDCAVGGGNDNRGCIVMDPDHRSYGKPFADANGGVFVTELASSGISVWFFPREKVPQSISPQANTLDTSTLGMPVANYPSGGCDIEKFFKPQSLILDITLCGDFGRPLFNATCSSLAKRENSCYLDVVLGSPSNYDTAYFDISYVRVYGSGNTSTGENGTNSTSTTNSGSGTNSTGSGSQGGGSSAAKANEASSLVWLTSASAIFMLVLGL
ncbi:hypothetical protein PQX77_005088 [Marasmius sp. AFHP31]|nr:hypothetical protein PQX77_005088 [Marasmius sp. AFHP31]